ncbi:MAG: hypothetical protein KBD50_03265 [Candidatus Pacebacteria bacterium]|nr:hypothetical protein [Candidatus Paceibacterota bacterium]
MAEEKKPDESGYEILWFVLGGLAVLITLWWFTGGPERADLRGLFLSPPPEAGGTGESYGPEFGQPNPAINNQEE